jgi:hypothetical protein
MCEGAAERAGAAAAGVAPPGGAGGRGRGDAAPPHHHPGTVRRTVTVHPIIRYFFYTHISYSSSPPLPTARKVKASVSDPYSFDTDSDPAF